VRKFDLLLTGTAIRREVTKPSYAVLRRFNYWMSTLPAGHKNVVREFRSITG
jgi:hypothetical protein